MRLLPVTCIGAELGRRIAFDGQPQPEVVGGWYLPREMQNARFSIDLKAVDRPERCNVRRQLLQPMRSDRKAGREHSERDAAFDGNGDSARLEAALPVASGGRSGAARAVADASGWGKILPPMRRPGGSTAQ